MQETYNEKLPSSSCLLLGEGIAKDTTQYDGFI